jgi:hypothetical protein
MKGTLKLAVLGAAALAASSTAALAGSELPSGALTGLALGAPLPEGVYALNISSYGSTGGFNTAYSAPLWLIWSTPWQIAGGRLGFSTYTGIADVWAPATGNVGIDSFLNTLVEGHLGWNLHNGFNVSVYAGAWLPSTQTLPTVLGRDYTAFQGLAAVSYIANGWNMTATGGYGSGGGGTGSVAGALFHLPNQTDHWQSASYTLDLTAARKYGKLELGSIAYGSWDLDGAKEEHFALGGLVGYDFGSFVAQARLGTDVYHHTILGDTDKETRGWVTIIKPLWNPEAESLK